MGSFFKGHAFYAVKKQSFGFFNTFMLNLHGIDDQFQIGGMALDADFIAGL